jgi:hypothetical protein
VKYIPVDFKHRVGSLDHIYGLYDMPTREEAPASVGGEVSNTNTDPNNAK